MLGDAGLPEGWAGALRQMREVRNYLAHESFRANWPRMQTRQARRELMQHRIGACGDRARAFMDDGLSKNGGRRSAVFRQDRWSWDATSRTMCAPMFLNLSSSSISLATVTLSLVVRGEPNDFLSRLILRLTAKLLCARTIGPSHNANPADAPFPEHQPRVIHCPDYSINAEFSGVLLKYFECRNAAFVSTTEQSLCNRARGSLRYPFLPCRNIGITLRCGLQCNLPRRHHIRPRQDCQLLTWRDERVDDVDAMHEMRLGNNVRTIGMHCDLDHEVRCAITHHLQCFEEVVDEDDGCVGEPSEI